MTFQITAASPEHPGILLELPWRLPLEEWPAEHLVALPRGISRHVVRFARAGGEVMAVKEVGEYNAVREYGLLRDLNRLGVPAVEPVAVVTGRTDRTGEALEPVLITHHLMSSMPYRALFETTMRPSTVGRLLDALAVLIVRLHLAGFAWGDCSLSNTLFRRDAGAFAAYLVDAETGQIQPRLSDGQRLYDIEVARVNVAGELMDLEEGGSLHPSVDPIAFGNALAARYTDLWHELTRASVYSRDFRHRIDDRIRRLNDLGFDVAEMQIQNSPDGARVTILPKAVDAGHHQRQLLRLTGLDAEENQARSLLNDLETYVANQDDYEPGDPTSPTREVLAHRWVREVFRPTVRMVPRELRGRMDTAQIYHEVLEHRWYLSEREKRDVGLVATVDDYVSTILVNMPDPAAPILDANEAAEAAEAPEQV
jgi:tRNA A-37 threonylcarbamoyl transferase component Bud32